MSGLLGDLWDGLQGGFLRKPLKKATGLTDAQLLGAAGMAVAAPYALPALGASGATAAGAAEAGSLTGGAAGFSGAQAAAPIVDASVAANPQAMQGVTPSFGGAGGSFSGALGNAGKLSMIGQQTGLLGGQHQPIQGAQLNRQAPQFSGLLTQPQDNDAQRRQQYQQYVQGLLGGSYGRSA